MDIKKDDEGYDLLTGSEQETEEVSLAISENERLSFSLPELEAQRLREAAEGSKVSISKKIREAVHTRLYFEEQTKAGGEIYIKTKENKLKKISLE